MAVELVSITETSEPVSVTDAKDYLRISGTDDDARLTRYIATARRVLEEHTGQALVPQVWRVTRDSLRENDRVFAPRVPVASAAVEAYVDAAWAAQADYSVSLAEGRVVMLADPAQPDNAHDGYRVTFTSTRTASNAPTEFKSAILELVSYWYDNAGAMGAIIPDNVKAMVRTHRLVRV